MSNVSNCKGRIIGHYHFQNEKCDVNKLNNFLEKINGEKIAHLRWINNMWAYTLASECTCSLEQISSHEQIN